jgi:hypothetical protein
MPRLLALGIVSFAGLIAAGCSSTGRARPDATFPVTEAAYETTFAAARDVLRDAGFSLERVDAARGVITTLPRSSSGFATPWIDHATSPGDAAAATLHRERRFAEVRFERAPSTQGADTGTILGRVEITIERLGAPGRKPEPTSIRLSSTWTEGSRRGAAAATPFDSIATRPDPALAARLAAQIERRAARVSPTTDG